MQITSFRIFVLFTALFQTTVAFGKEFIEEITYSVGMVNASYAENEGTLTGQNVSEAASGSISSISGNVLWKFLPGIDKSVYLSGTFPLMVNPQGSYFGAHSGIEFYFGNKMGSRMRMENSGTTIRIKPGNYYFWGLEGGVAYLAYSTLTAKKTDILLDLGAFAGGTYLINDNWQLRGQAGFSRGTGVQTTVTEMKFFVGVTKHFGQ
jgi:hypothetical protein